jgi:hypothetical protein
MDPRLRGQTAEILPVVPLNSSRAMRGDISRPAIAPDKWWRPQGTGVALAPGVTGTVLKIRWPTDLLAVELKFGILDASGLDDLIERWSAIDVLISVTASLNDQLFVEDDAGTFVPATTLFGPPTTGDGSASIYRTAGQSDIWGIQFRNRSLALTIRPDLLLPARLMKFVAAPEPTQVPVAR